MIKKYWTEGGLSRAALQALVGGTLTGDVTGAIASGSTSLAAPLIERASQSTGAIGKSLIDLSAGAAIGAITGDNTSAVMAASAVDWHNRQLHPKEIELIKHKAKDFAAQQGISQEQALGILAATALSQLDEQYSYLIDKTKHYTQAQEYLKQLGAGKTFTDDYGRKQTLFDERGNERNYKYNFSMNSEHVQDNKGLYNQVKALSPLYQDDLSSEILSKTGRHVGLEPAEVQKNLLDDLILNRAELSQKLAEINAQARQESEQAIIDVNIFDKAQYTLKGVNQDKVSEEVTKERIDNQIKLTSATNSFSNIYTSAESQDYLTKEERKHYQKENAIMLSLEGVAAFGGIDSFASTFNKALNSSNVLRQGVDEWRNPRILELFTDHSGVKVKNAKGVGLTDSNAIAKDATSMPSIPTASQNKVIANNPYLSENKNKDFPIMDFLPEAARVTRSGGKIVINGTRNNKHILIPSSEELFKLGLKVTYNGELLKEFKHMDFKSTEGGPLNITKMKTIIFEKE